MLSKGQVSIKVVEMNVVETEVVADEGATVEVEAKDAAVVAAEIDAVVVKIVVKEDNYFESKKIGNHVTA
jgi:hypothetical protein